MKKIRTTSCMIAVLGLLCIGSTLLSDPVTDATAYLSHRDEVNNQLTVGDNTSHITEDFTPPDDVTPKTILTRNIGQKSRMMDITITNLFWGQGKRPRHFLQR